MQIQPKLWRTWPTGQTSWDRRSISRITGIQTSLPNAQPDARVAAIPRLTREEQIEIDLGILL